MTKALMGGARFPQPTAAGQEPGPEIVGEDGCVSDGRTWGAKSFFK